MSILIKGMQMPPTTGLYVVSVDNTGGRDKTIMTIERMDERRIIGSFELVPIPPHGDLIDRDALKNKKIIFDSDEWDDVFDDGLLFVMEQVDNAPTIIPAEENHNDD